MKALENYWDSKGFRSQETGEEGILQKWDQHLACLNVFANYEIKAVRMRNWTELLEVSQRDNNWSLELTDEKGPGKHLRFRVGIRKGYTLGVRMNQNLALMKTETQPETIQS